MQYLTNHAEEKSYSTKDHAKFKSWYQKQTMTQENRF